MYYILSFVSTTFSTKPQPLFVFLQSESDLDNNRDKTKSCKHQSQEGVGIIVNESDKYIISFFFDEKGLKPSLLN